MYKFVGVRPSSAHQMHSKMCKNIGNYKEVLGHSTVLKTVHTLQEQREAFNRCHQLATILLFTYETKHLMPKGIQIQVL